MAWGTDAGYAINPARDFGPRLAEFFTGYGSAFRDQYGDLYFWVPIVAPIIGGLIGAGLYRVLIGTFLSDEASPDDPAAVPIDQAVPAEQPAP
jgi:glycerol uptake facilitator protein